MKQIIPLFLFILFLPLISLGEDEGIVTILKEADITLKDQELVKNSENSRGINITGEIVQIEGLVSGLSDNSSNVSGNVSKVNQMISDLGGRREGNLLYLQLSADVLFDFDKATIKPIAEKTLSKVAYVLKNKVKGLITIVGHTDSKGSDSYNQDLSFRRAQSTKLWLERNGVHGKYQIEGKGEKEPVSSNVNPDGTDNPEGRAKNRRVEIVAQIEGKK